MDKDVRAVFIGAIVSMVLSCIALSNHPTDCYVEISHKQEAHVYIGHTMSRLTELEHD